MNDRICLVEDDATIRELVAERLRARGFDVEAFETAAPAMPGAELYDLYIVDILLPGDLSGLDLCQALRNVSPTVPVLVLSALSDPTARIEGLKAGADDYLTKPFEMEELILRVTGMLKRRSWYGRLPERGSLYRWQGRSVDFASLEGRKGNEVFHMTQKECMLLKLLIEREGEVVSRDEILDRVWGYNIYPSTRTVDNFILRLRRYFEDSPKSPKYIHSVRGLGYKFTAGESDES